VAFRNETEVGPQVYLHWNGGPESVYAFLEEMNRRNIRGSDDLSYCTARFIHIVGDFFDQDIDARGLGLGVFSTTQKTVSAFKRNARNITQGGNGIYLVTRNNNVNTVER